MLLIASEALRGSPPMNDVVREMSLTLSFFTDARMLADLMVGQSRRIVLLAESDLDDETVAVLGDPALTAPFGVVIAAETKSLRSTSKAEHVDAFVELDNVEWIGGDFNFDRLAASTRRCRRRLLKLAQKDIEAAFDNFEFVVRYQPKVERSSGTEWLTQEAEALVRWRHPEHGLIGPLEFLPEIEAFGMMGRLTEFVLRKAAAQLGEWEKQGLPLNGCVNLAPSLLSEPDLGRRYAEIVGEFGVECSRFTFEVVEQDLANPEAPHLRSLKGLREAGFRLCLDDFRVAAASLGTFEQLPFDEIKVHASALKHARENSVAVHVLAAVTGLAHSLGMSVCAEGVEDEETFAFLKTIECDKMQGFLISEAVLPQIIRRVYSAKESEIEEDVA